MYGIYDDIYHQYTPVMLAHIPYMDPMGYGEEWHLGSMMVHKQKQYPVEHSDLWRIDVHWPTLQSHIDSMFQHRQCTEMSCIYSFFKFYQSCDVIM